MNLKLSKVDEPIYKYSNAMESWNYLKASIIIKNGLINMLDCLLLRYFRGVS